MDGSETEISLSSYDISGGDAGDTGSCLTNPGLCYSEIECLISGFNWCNNACQSTPCEPPPSDPILTVITGDGVTTASWYADNADGYILYWASSDGDGNPDITTLGWADMQNLGSISASLGTNIVLFIAVQAYNTAGYSGLSNIEKIEVSELPSVLISSEAIGVDGGIIDTTIPESDLSNIKIEIPENSVRDHTEFSISVISNPPNSTNQKIVGPVVDLEPDGAYFDRNITIHLPIDSDLLSQISNKDDVLAAYWDGSKWFPAGNQQLDEANNSILVDTSHFSLWSLFTCGNWYVPKIKTITATPNYFGDILTNDLDEDLIIEVIVDHTNNISEIDIQKSGLLITPYRLMDIFKNELGDAYVNMWKEAIGTAFDLPLDSLPFLEDGVVKGSQYKWPLFNDGKSVHGDKISNDSICSTKLTAQNVKDLFFTPTEHFTPLTRIAMQAYIEDKNGCSITSNTINIIFLNTGQIQFSSDLQQPVQNATIYENDDIQFIWSVNTYKEDELHIEPEIGVNIRPLNTYLFIDDDPYPFKKYIKKITFGVSEGISYDSYKEYFYTLDEQLDPGTYYWAVATENMDSNSREEDVQELIAELTNGLEVTAPDDDSIFSDRIDGKPVLLSNVFTFTITDDEQQAISTETDCTNEIDDDNDNYVDCDDPDCSNHSTCQTPDTETNCCNGYDDDQDGHQDCYDDDCFNNSACEIYANIVSSSSNQVITEGESIEFDASASGGTRHYSYQWGFNGGTPNTSNQKTQSVTFNYPGTYMVSLTVKDTTTNRTATDSVRITVEEEAENLSAQITQPSSSQTITEGESVYFSGSASGGSGSYIYSWTFNGGNPTSSTARVPGDVAFNTSGTYSILLTVQDGNGDTASDTVAITVNASSSPPSGGSNWTDPVTGMEFVWVEGGCYQMGCGDWANDNNCPQDALPVHTVCVDSFYIGKYEVTQKQLYSIWGSNLGYSDEWDDYPVSTRYRNINEFIQKFNEYSPLEVRLPTEAEWEYAARSGGREEIYSGSNNIDSVAVYSPVDQFTWIWEAVKPVGSKAPNGLGIYDMTGNLEEILSDHYGADYYSYSPINNPQGPTNPDSSYTDFVTRGGHARDSAHECQTYRRTYADTYYIPPWIGFRLVAIPVQ